MNLTRQLALFKDTHNLFLFTRGRLSNACAIQHNRGDNTLCMRLMTSMNRASTADMGYAVASSNPLVLTPVRH